MSGAAQLSWGDDGSIGLRSPLALAHNGESELSECMMYFLGANDTLRETLAQGVIGSKRNTPKKKENVPSTYSCKETCFPTEFTSFQALLTPVAQEAAYKYTTCFTYSQFAASINPSTAKDKLNKDTFQF